MLESTQASSSGTDLPPWAATVWPAASGQDSEAQRRKKIGVRSGHLAMVILVGAAVLGTVVSDARGFSALEWLGLLVGGLGFVAWNLLGTRGAVGLLLWEGDRPLPLEVRVPWGGAWLYFGVQLTLAGAVYWLGDRGRVPNLMWLVLLPPVAYAVFLLEWPGILAVTLLTVAVFAGNVVRWHGWPGVWRGLVPFSAALLFTLVFTLLIVSAEKARNRVQGLAAELRLANRKLREYAVQAEELAVTRERNRLAREIHDSLGHYLTVVHVQIQAAEATRDSDPARSRAALERARSLTQEGLREIRHSVATLRSSPLDNRLLGEALQAVVEEHRASGVNCRLQVLGAVRPLPAAAALTLYRSGQEGLTNVRKHARARGVELVLDFRAPGTVGLRVVDDGVGSQAGPSGSAGFGLLGLRERAQLLGGRMEAGPGLGGGFVLEVEVPA